MKRTTLFAVILALGVSANAQTVTKTAVRGSVYNDKNSNGVRDKNEEGLKDVLISDQATIVKTNDEGLFHLETEASYVFAIQPNNYNIRGSFWKKIPADQRDVTVDFAMAPTPRVNSFTFIHASDTHLSEQSLPRMTKLKSMVDSLKPAFMIVTGDLIKDALRVSEKEATTLYEMYVREVSKFSVPVWNVPGNHEIFGIERHKSLVSEQHPLYGKKMYRHYLGPDYYSFWYGGFHFIGLNSVDYHDLWYYGHIDSAQMRWIKQDIALVDRSAPIMTFNHIPFFSGGLSMMEYTDGEPGSSLITIDGKKKYRHVVTNAPEVIEAMKSHNYPIALAGHFHASQKFTLDLSEPKTEFHQTGAIVGPGGDAGVSVPSGFTLYTVTNGKVTDRKFIRLK